MAHAPTRPSHVTRHSASLVLPYFDRTRTSTLSITLTLFNLLCSGTPRSISPLILTSCIQSKRRPRHAPGMSAYSFTAARS